MNRKMKMYRVKLDMAKEDRLISKKNNRLYRKVDIW